MGSLHLQIWTRIGTLNLGAPTSCRRVWTMPRLAGRDAGAPRARVMEREHLQNLDVSWDHEPVLPKSFISNESVFRFMESGHLQNSDVSCDHELFKSPILNH